MGQAKPTARAGDLVEIGLDDCLAAIRRSRKRVWLASPFISRDVCEIAVEAAAAAHGPQLRLLTSLAARVITSGFLSIEGLQHARAHGFEIRSLRNLHAKVLVADGWALVGSGNFTAAGLDGGNAELGVVLSPAQLRRAARIFDTWWKAAHPVTERQLIVAARESANARASRGSRGASGFGGRLALAPGRALRARAALGDDIAGRGLWLKPLHLRADRDSGDWWERIEAVTDPHTVRDGRTILRPSYRVGDLLLIYVAGTFRCPVIVEVTGEPEEDLRAAARGSYPGDAERGWFTEVDPLIGVPLVRAPTLEQVGVARSLVQRRPRLRLERRQFVRAQRALAAARLP